MKGEIFTKKRILAIVLAIALLFSHVGGQFICCAEETQTESTAIPAEQVSEDAEAATATSVEGAEIGTAVDAVVGSTETETENEAEPVPETLVEEVGAETALEDTEAEITTESAEAGNYKTTKHLLSDGANHTTDKGKQAYSNIVDSKLTVEAILAKGGKYAKCKPEEKVKEEIDKEHYYKLSFENQVGSYVRGGYYDSKGKHHGAVHLVEKFYKKYQVYSQVYSYTVTNDTAKTVDYYYFIYIWRELIDDDYHKSSDQDYLTYCLQYGTSISKTDAAYAKEKKTYDELTEKQKYKVACAIYYGPHRASDGQYYTTRNHKLSADSQGYNPSTWSKTMWLRYAATQFYIWTVTNASKFSHADAVATAKQFDKDYPTSNESCYDFYISLKTYAEHATKLPSFMSANEKTASAESMSLQTDGSYAVTLHDDNGMIKDGAFSCDNADVTIQVDSDYELTLKASKQVTGAKLTFQKTEQIPDGNGLWYYANDKSQNMVDSVVSVVPCYGYLQLQTSDVDDTPLKVHKVGATTGRSYANAAYAVFTTWKSAAVYDPDTKTTMVDDKGKALKASDYVAGMIYQTATGQPWHFLPYSETQKKILTAWGGNVKTLYHLAYYVNKGYTSATLPSTYCITTDDTGWASTGRLKRRVVDGQDVTYYSSYMVEYQAPATCNLAHPIQIQNGNIVAGTCCLKWNTPEDYNRSSKLQKNEEHPGSLKIYKYEADTMIPLQNVTFHVYEDAGCTSLYRELVTGEDGYAFADQMEPGTYYVKEYRGQSVHVSDQGVTEVQIESDQITTIDKSNVPITVCIHLQKKADASAFPDGFSPEDYSVAGAEYTLYAAENIIGSNGTVLFELGQEIYTMVCDENGYAEIPMEFAKENLRLGSYYVKETKAPYVYELDNKEYPVDANNPEVQSPVVDDNADEFSVDQSVYHAWLKVDDEQPVKRAIRLHKTGRSLDYAGNWNTGNLSGAVFSVYCIDWMRRDGVEISKDSMQTISFAEETYDKYRVQISGNPENPYQMITDKEGNAQTTGLTAGDYVVVEAKAPAGYALAQPMWVSLPNDAETDYAYLEAEDWMLTGRIEILKTADMPVQIETQDTPYGVLHQLLWEKRALAGVEFVIYDADMKEIEKVTTKADGTAMSRELPLGTYFVQESKTPGGLVADYQCYKVQITENEQYEVVNAFVKVENDIMQTELAMYKVGECVVPSADSAFSIAMQPLEGVTFGIYNKMDILSPDGKLLIPANTLVGLATTDEHGEALCSAKLLPGNYYYRELRTLEGYEINYQSYDFSISLESNEPVERVVLNQEKPLINRYYKAGVRLHKVDASNEEISLQGVEFALYDALTNACVGYYVTDKNGEITIDQMPYGSWYFKETKPLPGYQVDTAQYTFEITEDEKPVNITVKNYPNLNLGYEESVRHGIFFVLVAMIGGVLIAVRVGKRRRRR